MLDDFHEVADAVHADVDQLLHHPPPALRLVIATRADPPLRLGRLRVQDQLTELREPDLAMTLDETTQMLAAPACRWATTTCAACGSTPRAGRARSGSRRCCATTPIPAPSSSTSRATTGRSATT